MKWFKHDSNAHSDAKLKRLKHKYGITGYGLYWYCVELIAGCIDKSNISFELEEDAELIALEWNLDQLKVQEIMLYMVELGLFEHDSGRITCLKLARRLDDTNSKNPQIREIINKIDSENQNVSETLGETPNNSGQTRLDKTRLDNKNNTSIGQADKPLATKIPYKQIVSVYHEELPTLAKVAVLSDKRKNAIKKIFNHHENHKSLDWWREYFQYVSSSEFLTNPSESSTNPNWRADFEWLTNFNNFVKIIEGKYHHAA